MSTTSTEEPSFASIVNAAKWDELRQRLKWVKKPQLAGDILFLCMGNPDVPLDIFEALLEKVDAMEDEDLLFLDAERDSITRLFFGSVCNKFYGCGSHYGMRVPDLIRKQTIPVLKIFFRRYEKIVGSFAKEDCRKIVCELCNAFLLKCPRGTPFDESFRQRDNHVDVMSRLHLFTLSCMNADLKGSCPSDLLELWQKIELVVMMTKLGGIDKAVEKYPFCTK